MKEGELSDGDPAKPHEGFLLGGGGQFWVSHWNPQGKMIELMEIVLFLP
jgi:hypothetical protein